MRKFVCVALFSALSIGLAGCKQNTNVFNNPTGPSGPSTNPPAGVSITEVSLNPGSETISINPCLRIIVFTATVKGTGVQQSVDWKWTGPSTASFESTGTTTTATLTIRTNGTYVVTATSTQDGRVSGSVTISVFGDCGGTNPPGPSPPGPGPGPGPHTPQCRDGVDNADPEDTLADYPADPGCSSPDDDDETNAPTTPHVPQCRDGVDNADPEDTLADYPADPGCSSPEDDDETNSPTPPSAPTCSLTANPNTVPQGGNVRLSWISTNTTTNVASGDWSGSKAVPSGFQDIIVAQNKSFTITCTGPGGTATDTEVVFVTAPACPTSIDYSPKGGTRTVGSVFGLVVDNWPSNVSCVPYWYSGNPSRFGILGGDTIYTAPDGSRYFAGVNGQGKAIAVGSTGLSAQTSIAIDSVSRTYAWTAVAASALEALGMKMPDPPLPKYNIYNSPGVCQTYPCQK